MKSLRKFFVMLMSVSMCLFIITGCGGDDDKKSDVVEEPSYVRLSNSSLSFNATSSSQTITVTSNSGWVITGAENWLTVSQTSGGSGMTNVVLTASANESKSSRTATIRVATTDGASSASLSVSQEGVSVVFEVDVHDLILNGSANSTGHFYITSNVEWEVSSSENWLTISTTRGTGNQSVVVTAQSDNNSSEERKATVSVRSTNETPINIEVTQLGLYPKDSKVIPDDIVALATSVATDFAEGTNVSYYYTGLYSPRLIERYTDAEIIADMKSGTRYTPNDGMVVSWSDLNPLSEYIICTVGFDSEGNHAELIKTPVYTKGSVNQPRAYISDVSYTSTTWEWHTTIGAYAKQYYQWVLDNNSSYSDLYNYTDAIVSWYFYIMLKYNSDDFAPIVQSSDWTRQRNGTTRIDINTWAVDNDGNLSGVMDRFNGQISSSRANDADKKSAIKTAQIGSPKKK